MSLIYNLKYSVEENKQRVRDVYRNACNIFKEDKELIQDLTRLRDFGLELAHFAPEYDFSEECQGNGFRSCLDYGILLLKYGFKKYHESSSILPDFKLIVKVCANSIPSIKRLREVTQDSGHLDTDTQMTVSLFSQWQEAWPSVMHFYSTVGTFDFGPMASTIMTMFSVFMSFSYSPSLISGIKILLNDEYRRTVLASLMARDSPVRVHKDNMTKIFTRLMFETIFPWLLLGSYPDVKQDIEVPRQTKYAIEIDAKNSSASIRKSNPSVDPTKTVTCRLLRDTSVKQDTLLVNYHGGGFVLGSRYSNDASLRYFIQKVPNIAAISVEYTLAPVKKFPTQLQECLDAYLFFASPDNIDEVRNLIGFVPKNIIISGDSAGGNLCLAVSVALSKIRRMDSSISLPSSVFVFYPVTSCYHSFKPSFLTNARTPFITPYGLLKMVPTYLPDLRCVRDDNENIKGIGCSETAEIKRQHSSSGDIPVISSILNTFSWVFSTQEWTARPHIWETKKFQELFDKSSLSSDPLVSPLLFDDFESLKEVSLFTYGCSFDGLLDDSVLITKKWKGPAKLTVFNNLQHGFQYNLLLKNARKGCDLIAKDLRSVIKSQEESWTELSNCNNNNDSD